MRVSLIGFFVVPSCMFIGCGEAKVKVETPDIATAAKSLEEGLKGVDVIGMNKLLSENGDLRATVEVLRTKLNVVPTGSGVIVAEGRDIQFTIPQYTGAFKITGYIDDPKNWIWQERVFPRQDYSLGVDFGAAIQAKVKEKVVNEVIETEALLLSRTDVVAVSTAAAEAKFQEFIRTAAYIPRPETVTVDLNSQLGAGSLHNLVITITPLEADKQGKWSLRGKVQLKRGATIETLKEFDVGSDITSNSKIGTALEPINILLMVKQSS